MGIRLKNLNSLTIRLEKSAARSTRQLRRVHRNASDELARVAKQMAPYKTGDLETSIKIEEARGAGNRKTFTIAASAAHAIYMHEGVYSLGPGSVAKQGSVGFPVGRKFMERAAEYINSDWNLIRKAIAAVRTGR